MTIKKTRKRKALAASALGLLGLAPQTASADSVNNNQTDDSAKEASSAASDSTFASVASNAHHEFSSAASLLDSSNASQASSVASQSSNVSQVSSADVNAPAERQKTDSANINESNSKSEDNTGNTVTFNVKNAFKASKLVANRMVMASLTASKLSDQYDAKGSTKTVIYGQNIDPNSLVENFSSLPAGTQVTAPNLDALKTKQGRNVVPITVTYSDGSTDTTSAVVWVTSQGTTALAKKVDLAFNPDTNKSEINTGVQSDVALPIYYRGTAVISADSVKKGARIYLANLAQKYCEALGTNGASNVEVRDSNGDLIGKLERYTDSGLNKLTELRLLVTTDKQYSSDLTIKFNITDGPAYNIDMAMLDYRSAYITDVPEGVKPYDYSGTIVQKRWFHEIGHDDIEYTINRSVDQLKAYDVMEIEAQTPGIWGSYSYMQLPTALGGYTSSSVTANFGDAGKAALANNIMKEVWASKGQEVPRDLPAETNLHEVWQATLPPDFELTSGSYINSYLNYRIQLAMADGTPSDTTSRSDDSENHRDGAAFPIYYADDNLTIQELYDRTPSGQIGISKQGNNTFLICTNLTADNFTPSVGGITIAVNRSSKAALSKDYEKILQTNIDFYTKNKVKSFASFYYMQGIALYFLSSSDASSSKNGTYILKDVTPGHDHYTFSSPYDTGSASAGGKMLAHSTAYFVDDTNNQAIVGGQHQISGGVGDTVPLNLTVPSGYVLADGQGLPTSYTFNNTNSDIVIHILPIYKSESLSETVNRTIDYKTTDGRQIADPRNDSLSFHGTKITGDLSSLIDRAKKDGFTITKNNASHYDDKNEALADLDEQAADIQKAITDYEPAKAAYDEAKKLYDKAVDKLNHAPSTSHALADITQGLFFEGEHDASLDVASANDKPVNFIKSSAWLGDGQGVYDYHNVSKSFGDSDITFSRAEGTMADSSDWGKTYTGVRLTVGDSVIARYTGLNNSVYIDNSGKAHKLSKVQIKYTLNETTATDNTANLFLSNNPNIALWIAAGNDKHSGSVDLTVDMTFFDENGNKIDLTKGSNAWLNMSSLNHRVAVEYFKPGDNTAVGIAGSTITKHDDGWYADSKNDDDIDGQNWDTPTSPNRYYGAALMELEGHSFHIGKKLNDSDNMRAWFALDSNVAAANTPAQPKAPAVPSISYHDVSADDWDDPKYFADAISPVVEGYTADKDFIDSDGIFHDTPDIVEHVVYTPEVQHASVTYIDETTGKTLAVKDLTGVTNAHSGYTTAGQIKHYTDNGYVLSSDSTNGQEIVFDNNASVDQDYTVKLRHTYMTVTPQNPQTPDTPINVDPSGVKYPPGVDKASLEDDVTRTITYVMADNSPAPAGNSQTLHYTAVKTLDKVTGQITDTKWSNVQNFDDVVSPAVQGYTPDKAKVSDKNIAHDHADIEALVRYTPDPQRATVTYIDDVTGKTLDTVVLNGVSNAHSGYTTQSAIDAYKFVGYQFVSDSTNGQEIVFDHDDAADQHYVVHLKRTYEEVQSPQKRYVHRTITYVMADGSSAPVPIDQTLTFTGKDTVDSVSKQAISTVWSGDQSFAEVAVPVVAGYTPDRTVIPSISIGHSHADIKEVVTYHPNPVSSTVTYIDDTTGATLKTDALSGMAGQMTDYSTANTIDGYLTRGYKLVSDETGQNKIIMPSKRMNFVVRLAHATEEATGPTESVTRTIHYVVVGNAPAPADKVDIFTFTSKVVKDKVTGQILKTIWSPNRDFPSVMSPAVAGFAPDLPLVSSYLASASSPDIHEVVTYKAASPSIPTPTLPDGSITVSYIDQNTGKVIKQDKQTGKSTSSFDYQTASQIKNLENAGYVLVKDETAGKALVFTNIDQSYSVVLKHGQDISSNNKTVNRTIKYVMTDGTTPPPAVHDSLTFRETVVKDKVTGAITSSDWSPNQDFKDIASPVIKGYTASRALVFDKNIAHDHADILETVIYRPSTQKATVTYVDETTAAVLENVDLSGYSNAGSGYTTANSLKIWEAYGYDLVKDETGGKPVYFDSDSNANQNYTVTLKHGKKTEDTSAIVKRTIDYVVNGKAKAPLPVHDSLTFKGTLTIDKVTGKVVSVTWSAPQDFKDIASPIIKGYTVDRTLVSDKGIAHDHPDIHEVVTYTPLVQKAKVIYVDDSNNQVLKTDDITGKSGTNSGYNTKSVIDGYLEGGYELVSDNTNGKDVVLDNDPTVDQVYYVYMNHKKQPLTKTITSDDNYVTVDEPTVDEPDTPVFIKNAETLIKTLVTKDAEAEIPAKQKTPSSAASSVSSAASSVASSASSAVSSVASSAPSSVASSMTSSVASNASSLVSSTPSSMSSVASSASSAPSSTPSSVAFHSASVASAKTLPQTGTDNLAAAMESVLGLASNIAAGGLYKKKRHKKEETKKD